MASYHKNGIKHDLYNFKLDNYVVSDESNKKLNSNFKLLPSTIRPFGKWYENKFQELNL
jgi:hypothetical protein